MKVDMWKIVPCIGIIFSGIFLPFDQFPGAVSVLWPAIVAISVILFSGKAALGLTGGLIAGALLVEGGDLHATLRVLFADYLFPALEGHWHIGAVLFTLLMGAFAGLLEKSGGFDPILQKLTAGTENPQKRLLGGVYLLGILCFFDGLANAILTGRIARPLVDRVAVSRERLAWVVDSTSSPVACVAFVSTWIATQLSLIAQGLEGAPFEVEPYALFFQSIPANPYCLLTLLLVPFAIALNYQPQMMKRYDAVMVMEERKEVMLSVSPWRVIVPLIVLVGGIFSGFALLSDPPVRFSDAVGWSSVFSGDSGPHALVFGSLCGLAIAWLLFPKDQTMQAGEAALGGAANLLPALLILVLAWALGNLFSTMGAGEELAKLLGAGFAVEWLPLLIFLLAAFMAVATGSSWGTMGLLMPLALPAFVEVSGQMPVKELRDLLLMAIGAVFGGAVLGDHCSPFSDTTIVSAVACGCEPSRHVYSQLPFVAIVGLFSVLAYGMMALGLAATISTPLCALGLIGSIYWLKRREIVPV